MAENAYKIRATLGDNPTFEVEGDEEAARDDYRAFLDAAKAIALAKASATPASPPATATAAPTTDPVTPLGNGSVEGDQDGVDLKRAFLVRDNVVTLQALPQSETDVLDAVIAILYGFAKIDESTTVTALALAKALRLSGRPRPRIDRDISDAIGTIITKSGSGRGTRYGLTNTGYRRAVEIIRALHA